MEHLNESSREEKTGRPYAVFQTQDELVLFVEKTIGRVEGPPGEATKESEATAELARAAKWMEEPVAVERGDLRRVGEALGEISMQLTAVRKAYGPAEEFTQIFEAIVEAGGLLHSMHGRCFMPDPTDEGADGEQEGGAQ